MTAPALCMPPASAGCKPAIAGNRNNSFSPQRPRGLLEPCAGTDPHARFLGGGSAATRSRYPTMITWHARVYNLRKYRPTTAYCIKLGKSGTRRSPAIRTRYLVRQPHFAS